MDTKTPPIPLRPQERIAQPRKTERVADDVSLPPLTPYPSNHPKNRSPGTSENQSYPTIQHHHRDDRKTRPYRVLDIGATPLMHACQQGDRTRVLKLLKEQEETIACRDRTLRNALHYCMEAGTGGAVAAAAPQLVNAPDAEGHTPLHLAVIAGDTQLVAVLLANGADVNAKDLEGHGVLHWATVCGEAECVRLVLAAGARASTPDLRGGSPLHYAAQCCGAAATAELAVPKKVGLKVLQTLLEFGADVNAKDEDGRQPILWAASAGSVEAVLALARAGGSAAAGTCDKDGLTALHCAASRGHAGCVEALVNLCGSQPDHVDDNGCSALHYAATLGHADATALVLKLGADPNRQDRKGRTPALCAAAKGQLETLKILTQHGGSLHVRTVRGTGIGHEAVASGRIELMKWLAKRRPSTLDVATHDGKTPLHVAALHGHLDACKVLLDHGARINAVLKTSRGNAMTPLDAALYRGHRDCAKLIQMHGGTTAQRLGSRNTAPNKVFTAKLRVRRAGSSSSSSSSTRLSKTSSRRDERRARSESARYDANRTNQHHRRHSRRKRNRGGSTRTRKHQHSDESSDSCDYSHDENEASARRHCAKRRQERTKDSNNSGKEDDRSVSDDSLEVIVVKKSLEKKCEKVVSGRRSKTPRECTKETRFTKTHKRSSKRTSRSGRSKITDNDEDGGTAEHRGGDATDSTGQETVERVVVTAMVHKDQVPDTPKTLFETTRETDEAPMGFQRKAQQQSPSLGRGIRAEPRVPVEDAQRNETRDRLDIDTSGENKDGSNNQEEMDGKSVVLQDSRSCLQNCAKTSVDMDEKKMEKQQVASRVVPRPDEYAETARRKVASDDSGASPSRRSLDEAASASKDDVKGVAETRKRGKAVDTASSFETVGLREEGTETREALTDLDDSARGKSADLSSTGSRTSTLNVGETILSTERSDKEAGGIFSRILGEKENFRYMDESLSSPKVEPAKPRPSTGRNARTRGRRHLFGSSEERSSDRAHQSAIVAVIDSPEWDEDEAVEKEIREAFGEDTERDTEHQEDNGVTRVLPSTSEEETPTAASGTCRISGIDSRLPRVVRSTASNRFVTIVDSEQGREERSWRKQRRDSGGRDSGIEPSPRVSKIPRRRNVKCCPNTTKQQALDMETVTRDVQISLRRYHLERKIFFQLMELKRLQIRHGRGNEHVLVKRQVEAFHRSGMSGPTLGVARYDRQLTFREFEAFLYEQLRRLQGRPTTPDFCTEAKQCTRKTHRCHHATSAYTSVPVYTYLGGGVSDRADRLPKIESRGKGQMTVEVTHGEEKQVIALPTERLDRTKRYFVTFTVRGETRDVEKPESSSTPIRRNAKSV
ncbi:inversin isoform X1 [Ooceraea biroi]|uniref:inversin isoform X1 n=1 Tax=Ooceraea biroi TaxID=2015173 RepID=UPI000F0756F3|nr:inversin isoform X1 [Ooceraea biroi]XP_019885886.2 inversin isoform X1 [Ooceraea biroi]XP_019885887.2 inversin isoform X1 [Ooceraea biroi]